MSIGPVVMEVVGDEFIESCRIGAVVWAGATSSGNEARVTDRKTGALLWHGVTDTNASYLGISFGRPGLAAPNGFRLEKLDAGSVYVYILED